MSSRAAASAIALAVCLMGPCGKASASSLRAGDRLTYLGSMRFTAAAQSAADTRKVPPESQFAALSAVVMSKTGPRVLEYSEHYRDAALDHLALVDYGKGVVAGKHPASEDAGGVLLLAPRGLRVGALTRVHSTSMIDNVQLKVVSMTTSRINGALCREFRREAVNLQQSRLEGPGKPTYYQDRVWVDAHLGVVRKFESVAKAKVQQPAFTLEFDQKWELSSMSRLPKKQLAQLNKEARALLAINPSGETSSATLDALARRSTSLTGWIHRFPHSRLRDLALAFESQVKEAQKMKLARQQEPEPRSALLDHPAPDLTLRDLAGSEHMLKGYRGKTILLNFFASW